MGFEQRFDLRPDTGEQGVKFISAEIAEPQMHHPRRRRFRDYPIRKIRILADDDQIMLPGKFPDLRIGWIPADFGGGNNGKLRRKPQPRGQVFIEEKTLHAAAPRRNDCP